MFKSKIAKLVGGLALSGALLFPAMPADASTLQWVRDAYPNADYYQYNGNQTVTIKYGSTTFTVTCAAMVDNLCYVRV